MRFNSAAGRFHLVAIVVGLCGGLGQVVVLRELMVLAGGNELSLGLGLACWLAWGGMGSLMMGRMLGRAPAIGPAWPLFIISVAAMASLLLCRLAPALLGLELGQVSSLGQMLGVALMVLAPLGWADGAVFPLILGAAPPEREFRGRYLPRLYGLDALGHTLAAALFGLVLVRLLNPAALVLGAAALAACAALAGAARRRAWAAAWLVLAGLGLIFSPGINAKLMAVQWQGRNLLAWAESPYAQLVATGGGSQRDVFLSGLWSFSRPDRLRMERSALLPLLAAPRAKRVLFIGGGADGSAAEAARRAPLARVQAMELDPWLVRFAGQHAGQKRPGNLQILSGDGRAWLERHPDSYGLVVVEQPPPATVGINRFYSAQGLAAMARALKPGGVAVISLPGVEALMGPMQAARLASILAAARQSFKYVAMLSGQDLKLFLCNAPGILPQGPQDWAERLRAKNWRGLVAVRPDTLESEGEPWRLAQMTAMAENASPQVANSDFRPRALLLDAHTWGAQLGGRSHWAQALSRIRAWHLLLPLAGLVLVWWLLTGRPGPRRANLYLSVAVTGLTSMALSVLLMMAYQALAGAVYVGLALLLAGFMLGLCGAPLALSGAGWQPRRGGRDLALLTVAIMAACLLTMALVQGLAAWGQGGARLLMLAALLDGGLTGAYFGLAGRVSLLGVSDDSPGRIIGEGGRLYGLDLLGGVAGAVLPMFLLPTVGFGAAMIWLAALNVIPLAGFMRKGPA